MTIVHVSLAQDNPLDYVAITVESLSFSRYPSFFFNHPYRVVPLYNHTR